MKPFLGIDLTTNKKNEQLNGTEFLVAQPSAAVLQALDQSTTQMEEAIKQSKLPLPWRIVQSICCMLSAICFIGFMRALGEVTIAQAYRNAPWIIWLGVSSLVIWLTLKIMGAQQEKAVMDAEESSQILSNFGKTCEAAFAELGVPKDAIEVDILSFLYKEKNGKIKVTERGMQIYSYLNPLFKVFADDENLYFVNLRGKYAFPLSSLVAIHTIKKHIQIAPWQKNIGFNEGIYQQYKLTCDNYGGIHCKQYHILEVNHNGLHYGIYIPCYELPVFEKLTGLKAEEA